MKKSIHILCDMWYKNLSTVSAILHSTIIVHKMARIFLLGFDNKRNIHNDVQQNMHVMRK